MDSICTLYNREAGLPEYVLPEDLRTLYGGDLCFPPAPASRPYVVANFVSTLDGVVSFNIPGQSGGVQISGSNDADRFIMGLLRASADAVLVGAGTVGAVSPSMSGSENSFIQQQRQPTPATATKYYGSPSIL